jgi:SHS2 domain-containing protein
MSVRLDFEFIDEVTSDLTFVARGPTLEALFRSAAEALLAATVDSPKRLDPRERRHLEREEPNLELLLLAFLNDLVYLRDAEGLLLRPDRLRVVQGEDSARLVTDLVGETLRRDHHAPAAEVKAATAHGLRVERRADGWEAQVTLDV